MSAGAAVEPEAPPRAGWADVAAGAALGLLLGLLVGLSASPVVGSVVSALVALLAGVFGLSEKLPAGLGRAGAARLAAFGVAAAVAVCGGIAARAGDWLMPGVDQQRRQLAEIGITQPAEVKDMLRFLRYGLLPAGASAVGKDGEGARQAVAGRQGVLYADNAAWCASMRRAAQESAPLADLQLLLDQGPEPARRAARALARWPEAERLAAARAAALYLCSEG